MTLKVWIDTKTGTWGTNVDDLVIVDLEKQATYDADPDEDEWSLLAFLEQASDTEICVFAEKHRELIERGQIKPDTGRS